MKMMRCYVLSVIVVGVICLTSGCTTYRAPLKPTAELPQGRGYLYGRYTFGHKFGGYWLGLIVTEQTTKKRHRIRFRTDSGIAVIDVPPGEYAVTHYSCAPDWGYGWSRSIPYAPSLLGSDFRVEAGHMCYIGDYVGSTHPGRIFSTGNMITASVNANIDSKNNYETTTAQVKKLYPHLSNMQAISIAK